MNHLIKNMKQNISFLRKFYKQHLSDENKSAAAEWLTDNFHVAEKNYAAAVGSVKNNSIKNRMYAETDICFSMCRDGVLPSDDKIIACLLKESVTTAFLCHLHVFVSYVLLDILAKSIKNQSEQTAINAIKSLLRMRDTDFGRILFEVSETEKILCQDPAGIYRNMEEGTKARYREAVSKTAEKTQKSETKVAVEALENAKEQNKHIGFFLDIQKNYSKTGKFLIAAEAIIPLLATLITACFFRAWYLVPLLYLPFREGLKFLTDLLAASLQKTNPLPKMKFSGGVPEEAKTVIALSTLLPDAGKARNMIPHLKDLCLSNGMGNVAICVLADMKSADTPTTPSDRANIKAMKRVINQLNNKYDGKFILAVRPRAYSATENEYTGKERKRGAISSLVKFICGEGNDFLTILGDEKKLLGAKYIMALDSDTEMPMGSLHSLVETASHPLNEPVISYAEQRVTSGYGIITPRIETSIESAAKTHFSSLLSGSGGIPAYSSSAGEKYQDFFSESIFSGKGLIHVHAFNSLLTDRFPEQRILSHDILEGMILRTAFGGDTALTDSFPSNENSYFKRLHRWIRGDIQNLPLLFKKRKSIPSGELPQLGKWWLLDNLRRSITPVFAVLTVFLSLFMPPKTAEAACVIALLSAVMPDLFSAVVTLIRGGISMISRLYFSSAAPYAMTCLIRAVSTAVMLVRSAVCSFDAVMRASFRLIFSKKHLLQWTTAAEGEKDGAPASLIKKSLPSLLLGILLLVFGRNFLRLTGIVFLFDLPFALWTAQPKKERKQHLTETEKSTLLSYCASMWKFYEKYCTKNDNWLIPDNVQETPVYALARRTSPTNIGLMLCAFLAARDFNFISTAEMKELLDNALTSIEKLEKYNGNLYNWYSTKTLEVLKPAFVSCVDSGNFLCCLTALKEGLSEYIGECGGLSETIERITALIDCTDLGFMFDKRRNLFHIGFDCESNDFTNSYFDLLMSEARMTSYFAVASGAVPIKHWQSLGRTLSKSGRYTGPVSWSGTMFEYFMPAIFLPSIRNSLGSEALRFCIHCQKKRVKNMNIPYGISESGFFAFDRELSYQYKAHGVRSLSLRFAPDDEVVISPYSTFLTLGTDPHGGMDNLKKLKKTGMYGELGFYEAADYTRQRTENKRFSFVRSYMAHHVGMSFLASANAVFNNNMQKRFMRDDKMAGGRSLLYEKIPSDAKIYKSIERREAPKRPERTPKIKADHNAISVFEPNSTLLTNGEWSVFASDAGINYSVFSNALIFKNHENAWEYPDGLFAAIKEPNGDILPFTKTPVTVNTANCSCAFTENSIVYKNFDNTFYCTETVTLHPKYPAEMISFTVRNRTKSKKSITLMIYAEPRLLATAENVAHPAFSNMFIECKNLPEEHVFTFTRKQACKEKQMYIAGGFLSKRKFEYSFDREAVLSRDKGIFGLFQKNFDMDSVSVDKCIALQLTVHLSPGAAANETLILCGSGNPDEAVNTIIDIRNQKQSSFPKCTFSPFDMTGIGGIYARKIMERAFFGAGLPKIIRTALQHNTLARADLWSLGISGDFPIITARIGKDEESYRNAFITMHRKLRLAGIITELILLSDTVDGYIDEMKNAVIKLSATDMLNSRGGIFTLHINDLSKDMFQLLLSSSVAVYPESAETAENSHLALSPVKYAKKPAETNNLFVRNGYMIGKSPYLPWSHVICNKNFGTLITDSSLGYSWCMNARENKLTPWVNDTRSTAEGEQLLLSTENGRYNIIKGASAFYQNGAGCFYSRADSISFKTEITVPNKNMGKEITISMKNEQTVSKEFLLSYFVLPILGDTPTNRKYIQYKLTTEGAVAYTPYNTSFGGYLAVAGDNKCDFSFSRQSFLTNTKDNGDRDCIIATRKIYLPGKSDKTIKFYLSYAKKESAAVKMPTIHAKSANRNRIEIDTPDTELNRLFNDFLPNQIIGGRLFGRVGFYQCSGAYGFRDQLQDAMSVSLTHPEILKSLIFRCAAAQFTEGDVLHWFHEFYTGGKRILRGVRTNYSDDLLWLPLAVSEYCIKNGDYSVLKTEIPFIIAPVLEKDENERFGEFVLSDKKDTLFNHCLKAIKHACAFGAHSLPLIKSGDWNDSFNAVGIKGKGESVWLAMFLAFVCEKFSALCTLIGETDIGSKLNTIKDNMCSAVDTHAWSNDRYLRCFYDDGNPMGIEGADQCEIDLLPQAWSVISGMPDKDRCQTAMETAYRKLVDKEHGVIKLFSPPFTSDGKEAGYVNRYPEGIRENGGQYSHGAVWLADACFRMGNPDRGYELLNILNPAKKDAAVYKTEPYYIAGDVYSRKGMEGRGGWSLYTGSAGWFYRTVYERMLGIHMINGEIKIKPCLPKGFENSRVKIITENGTREFKL